MEAWHTITHHKNEFVSLLGSPRLTPTRRQVRCGTGLPGCAYWSRGVRLRHERRPGIDQSANERLGLRLTRDSRPEHAHNSRRNVKPTVVEFSDCGVWSGRANFRFQVSDSTTCSHAIPVGPANMSLYPTQNPNVATHILYIYIKTTIVA